MKKIAFFIPRFEIGGVEKVFITYANALVDRYDVSVIVLKDEGVLRSTLSDEVKVVNLRVGRLRYMFIPLVFALWRYRFDYLVTGIFEANIMAVLAGYLTFGRTRVIASKHNIYTQDSRWLRFAFKHAHRVFAVSNAIGEELLSLGVPENRLKVIYNPLDLKAIEEEANEEVEGLPMKYVVFVGRVMPIKNIQLLIKAFELFVKKHDDFKLVIVGDGDMKNRLAAFARRLGIEESVVWVGGVANPYPYIKNAEILVLPSFSEGLSLVVEESIALGKTVVTTTYMPKMELTQPPKYGYAIKGFKNPTELCGCMEYAIEHPISPELLQEYSKRFDLQFAVKEFEGLLV